jgi:hypothetical protein
MAATPGYPQCWVFLPEFREGYRTHYPKRRVRKMANIFAGRGNVGNGDRRPNLAAGDYEGYPHVSQLMVGVARQNGDGYETPPHTLIAWVEGTLLFFLFNAGDDQPRLFGSTSGISHGLEGIETALASGNCQWKPPKGKKSR